MPGPPLEHQGLVPSRRSNEGLVGPSISQSSFALLNSGGTINDGMDGLPFIDLEGKDEAQQARLEISINIDDHLAYAPPIARSTK
jgi:hypothetical protein